MNNQKDDGAAQIYGHVNKQEGGAKKLQSCKQARR